MTGDWQGPDWTGRASVGLGGPAGHAFSTSQAVTRNVTERVETRLLSAAVFDGGRGRTARIKEGLTWKAQHLKYRMCHVIAAPSHHHDADRMKLTSPRQRDAWQTLVNQHPKALGLVADLSQNLGRMPASTTGVSPTVTPGSVICVRACGRVLSGLEKLLIHGFPVHRMNIPASISDSTLGDLGGNTMHLKCVGLAIMIAIGLTRWPAGAPPSTAPRKLAPRWVFSTFGFGRRRSADDATGRILKRKKVKQ
jgi:hypothetical protein